MKAGANEAALDMFTRVAIDNLTNLGRTFRVLMDYYAQQMTPEVRLISDRDD